MHPSLFRIPLPAERLALSAPLVAAGVLALLLAGFGVWRRSRDLALAGGFGALSAFAGALFFRGRVLVLGALPLPAFGVLLALGLALGVWLTRRAAARDGWSQEFATRVCAAAIVGGLVGARVTYVLLHARELASFAQAFAFRDGGLTAHGAVLGAVVGVHVAARRSGTSSYAWLDAAAPGFLLGVALTRFGCWLEGCDFGRKLAAPLRGLDRLGTFPSGSRAWTEQVIAGELPATATASLPVHPAQLYELAGALFLLGITLAVRGRQRRRGQLALLALVGYGLVRVGVDAWRSVSAEVWAARVLALIAVGVAVHFVRTRPPALNTLRES